MEPGEGRAGQSRARSCKLVVDKAVVAGRLSFPAGRTRAKPQFALSPFRRCSSRAGRLASCVLCCAVLLCAPSAPQLCPIPHCAKMLSTAHRVRTATHYTLHTPNSTHLSPPNPPIEKPPTHPPPLLPHQSPATQPPKTNKAPPSRTNTTAVILGIPSRPVPQSGQNTHIDKKKKLSGPIAAHPSARKRLHNLGFAGVSSFSEDYWTCLATRPIKPSPHLDFLRRMGWRSGSGHDLVGLRENTSRLSGYVALQGNFCLSLQICPSALSSAPEWYHACVSSGNGSIPCAIRRSAGNK